MQILFAATPGTIGDTEQIEVAWCTKSGRGTRTIPNGALKGVHFVKTPDYVQVTGVGDFTKINVPKGDYGGELDNRGADGALSFFFVLSRAWLIYFIYMIVGRGNPSKCFNTFWNVWK